MIYEFKVKESLNLLSIDNFNLNNPIISRETSVSDSIIVESSLSMTFIEPKSSAADFITSATSQDTLNTIATPKSSVTEQRIIAVRILLKFFAATQAPTEQRIIAVHISLKSATQAEIYPSDQSKHIPAYRPKHIDV